MNSQKKFIHPFFKKPTIDAIYPKGTKIAVLTPILVTEKTALIFANPFVNTTEQEILFENADYIKEIVFKCLLYEFRSPKISQL